MAAKSTEQALAELMAARAKIDAKARALLAKRNAENRKAATRRAIIMGNWVMRNDPTYAAGVVPRLERPQDREAFQGWEPPVAAPGGLAKGS